MESVVADSETLCMDGDIDLNDLDYTKLDSAASAFLEQNLVEFEQICYTLIGFQRIFSRILTDVLRVNRTSQDLIKSCRT